MVDIDLLIKNALKGGDKIKTNAYRNLKSKIMMVKTAKNAKPYDDAVEIALISKYAKELTEDAKLYQDKGRTDLSESYIQEVKILSELLPKEPTEVEIKEFIELYIKSEFNSDSIDKSKMGTCIKAVKVKYPSADGKKVSEIVRAYIK